MKFGFFIIIAVAFGAGLIIGYSYKAQVIESQIMEAEKFFPIIEAVINAPTP